MSSNKRERPPKKRPVLGAAQTLVGVAASAGANVVQTLLSSMVGALTMSGVGGLYTALLLMVSYFTAPARARRRAAREAAHQGPIRRVAGRLMRWLTQGPIGRVAGRSKKRVCQAAQTKTASIIGLTVMNITMSAGFGFAIWAGLEVGIGQGIFYALPLVVLNVIEARGNWSRLRWSFVTFVGVVLLTQVWTGSVNLTGMMWILVATLARTLSSPLLRRHRRNWEGDEARAILISSATSALMITVWAVVSGETITDAWRGPLLWVLPLIGVVFFVSSLSRLAAMTHIDDGMILLLTCLTPALGAVLGWVFLDQALGWLPCVGIALITVGLMGAVRSARPKRGPRRRPVRYRPGTTATTRATLDRHRRRTDRHRRLNRRPRPARA
ncbi:EamA family transporter [Actinomadura miaoliensis]|uniref:DMT family transporter n=1 Tax=Actinomadura miaoliensis TaxID=430685 RepID=A0ABP7VXF1_9ACTN